MSGPPPSIQQNTRVNLPRLTDALSVLKDDIFIYLNAHHVGTIQSFNSEVQTAVITINYVRTYFDRDSATGQYVPRLVPYPILLDCPVICLGGAGGALTFPIAAGDECLVLFNDRDIGNWFEGNIGAAVPTPRLHSISDGIALVGLRSLPKTLDNYDATRVMLRGNLAGTTRVAVGATQVEISNAVDGTLGAAMTGLLTALSTFMTALAKPAILDPGVKAAAAAFTSTATPFITKIEGILE